MNDDSNRDDSFLRVFIERRLYNAEVSYVAG